MSATASLADVCGDCAGTGGVLDDGSMTGRAGAPIACPGCTEFWSVVPFGADFRAKRPPEPCPGPSGWSV